MMVYIDLDGFRALIEKMLNDPNVKRKDLMLANYLYTDKSKHDVVEWYGGSKNRAEAGRALKRLDPYLEKTVVDDQTYYQLKREL